MAVQSELQVPRVRVLNLAELLGVASLAIAPTSADATGQRAFGTG